MNKVVLEGFSFATAHDVHAALAEALDFGSYYGFNLDALWDVLTTDVKRPVIIEWKDSLVSEKKLGAEFERIVDIRYPPIVTTTVGRATGAVAIMPPTAAGGGLTQGEAVLVEMITTHHSQKWE